MSQPNLQFSQLRDTPGLDGLSDNTLEQIIAHAQTLELKRNAHLFNSGDPYGNNIYIVYSGELKSENWYNTSSCHSGEFIGLGNYIEHTDYTSTLIAQQDSVLIQITADDFHKLEQQHSDLASLVDRCIARNIRQRGQHHDKLTGIMAQPVCQFMKSPLASCDTALTLKQAFSLMHERKIGSLGITNKQGKLFGVLTYAGLAEAFALKEVHADSLIDEAVCEAPITIDKDAPLWQAEQLLQQRATKYIIATEGDKPVGLLSQTDLLHALLQQASEINRQITSCSTLEELRQHFDHLYIHAREYYSSHRLASQAIRSLSELHLNLQCRCVELIIKELQASKAGPPPREFALLIMGSGGRKDMLLNPDQDNGLIIANEPGPLSKTEAQWFESFSAKVNQGLADIGYILCPGDIMARNEMFRKTLSQWQQQFSYILRHPNETAARWSNIVFDFNTLYGNDDLTRQLREHLLSELKEKPALLEYMAEDDAEGRPALGFFNQLVTSEDKRHKGAIDIKRNGLRIITDAARIYALSAAISHGNTRDRLNALVHQGILSADLVDSVMLALEELLDMLLLHQIEQIENHQTLDKLIYPESLSSQSRSRLRLAMQAVKRFQDQLLGKFGRTAF